jgi:hypothetical protein
VLGLIEIGVQNPDKCTLRSPIDQYLTGKKKQFLTNVWFSWMNGKNEHPNSGRASVSADLTFAAHQPER